MSEKDKELVRNTKDGDLILFNHGWGTGIRNYYRLWRSNKKLIEWACGGPCQPDDTSMIIIRAEWGELKSKSIGSSSNNSGKCVATDKISARDALRCLQDNE
jgi:hypothetical protein